MTDKELVSVIVPMYNAEAHLEASLTAITRQNYEHLELIIVNDASTDSSRDIAQRVLSSSGITYRIIDHPSNLGVAAARNTGLASARGVYVWFCDSDDLPDENFVRILCAKAQAKDSDAVFCSLKNYYEDEDTYRDEVINASDSMRPETYLEAWADGRIYFWSVWNFLFKKSFLLNNKLHFVEGCIYGEDTEFVLKALALAGRISFVKDILYTYVHHRGQTVSKRKEPLMFRSLIESRSRMWRFVMKHTASRKVRRYILGYCMPDMLVKRFTVYAEAGDTENYQRLSRCLKHKKIRGLLLSSARYIITKPELFFKSITLIYAPRLYYSMRRGHHED